MKNLLLISFLASFNVFALQIDVIKDEVCQTLKCEKDLKKSIKDAIYWYAGGATTVIPMNAEIGVGIEIFKNLEVEAFIAQDLVSAYGPRPYTASVGGRARFLWGSEGRRMFIEIEDADYLINQNKDKSFSHEFGVFYGSEFDENMRASVGLKSIHDREPDLINGGLVKRGMLIPTLKLQIKFGGSTRR